MYKAAFFDFDGTLINNTSLISFLEFQKTNSTLDVRRIEKFLPNLNVGLKNGTPREVLNRFYYSIFKGICIFKLERDAKMWYRSLEHEVLIKKPIVDKANELKRQGYKIVIVSGSFRPLIEQIKNYIIFDSIICSEPEEVGGCYTGELLGKPCIGINKQKSIIRYSLENRIDLKESFAFGDDETDEFMLQIVGKGIWVV